MTRLEGWSCADCIWWERGANAVATVAPEPGSASEHGACHHRAPTILPLGGGSAMSVWPITHQDRFCGDFADIETSGDGPGGGQVIPFERNAA